MNEHKNMSISEIHTKVDAFRRDLFTLRLNAKTAHVKDYSQFKKLRRNIARTLTQLSKETK